MSCTTVHVIPHLYASPSVALYILHFCVLVSSRSLGATDHLQTVISNGWNQKGATRKWWGLRKCTLEDNELMLIFLFLFCLHYWLNLESYMLRIDSDLSDKKQNICLWGEKNISVRFIVICWNKENYSIEKNDRIKKLGIKFKATWHIKSWGNGAVERWSAPKLARCWN